jgi:ribulose bisphosphate carboxylase small subunit
MAPLRTSPLVAYALQVASALSHINACRAKAAHSAIRARGICNAMNVAWRMLECIMESPVVSKAPQAWRRLT